MNVATTSKHPGVIQFAANLQGAADRLDIKLATFLQKLVWDLYQLIVMETPVDTGRARESWNVAFDEPNESVPPAIPDEDKKKRAADKAAGRNVGIHPIFQQFAAVPPRPTLINDIDGKHKIFITSNLEYINALEHGHSQQRPHGMVRVNVAAMEAAIEAAARG